MSQFTITFSANCFISQTIEPFEGYSKEDILEGLNNGKYLTTLGHTNGVYGDALIFELPSFTRVATIVSQTVEDSEYYDFTESEEEFEDEDD